MRDGGSGLGHGEGGAELDGAKRERMHDAWMNV